MSDLYNDYGLEVETDNMGADPQLMPQKTTVVKKGGALGKVVALLLGFVIGAGGIVGGVAGAGYWVATKPLQNTFDTVNNLTGAGIDFNQFVSKDYAQLKVIDLVGELAKVAEDFANQKGTLNHLAKISPYVSTALDPVLETVKGYGLELDKDTLMSTVIGELPTYIAETAKDMALADLLNTAGATQTPLLKAICYDQNGNPITIRMILDNGPETLLHNVPLEALLIAESGVVNPDEDRLIMTLSYGNANRYTITSENKVEMNQMSFTKAGGKFYDVDGNEQQVNPDNTLVLSEGSKQPAGARAKSGDTLYLKASSTDPNLYYAYEDAAFTIPAFYEKTMVGDLMGGNATEIFNTIELGSLFNISPLDKDPDVITLALAYGEKGTHYDVVEGKVVWLEKEPGINYKPRTIGDLMGGDLTGLIGEIKLGTLFKIDILDNHDDDPNNNADPITHALAFGELDTHYYFDENGEIQWHTDPATNKPYHPRTIGDLLEGNMSDLLYDMKLGTMFDISPLDNYDSDPTNDDPDPLMLALAYGEKGKHYDIKQDANNEYYIDWRDSDGDPLTENDDYKPRTVRELVEDSSSLFDEIYLGTVLGITPLDNDADALMLALAYGYEKTHYEFNATHTDVTYIQEPKTIKALMEGNAFDEIRLATVLNADIHTPVTDPKYDAMTQAMAFGYEGVHYDMVEGEPEWRINTETGEKYDYRTVADLSSMTDVVNELRIETALGINKDSPKLLQALAFGSDYSYDAEGNLQNAQYNTLADLSKTGDDNIINTLKIKDMIEEEELNSSELLKSLGNSTLNSLPDDINKLTVTEILGADKIKDNLLLSHLGDSTLTTLPADVQNLTFKQIYPNQIYNSRYAVYDDAGHFMMQVYYDGKNERYCTDTDLLVPYNGSIEDIVLEYELLTLKKYVLDGEGNPTFTEDSEGYKKGVFDMTFDFFDFLTHNNVIKTVVEEGNTHYYIAKDILGYNETAHYYTYTDAEGNIYETHLVLTGQWKYLLVDKTDATGDSHDYAITDFSKLVTNMTSNMASATLYDLKADGIITELSDDTLNTPVPPTAKLPSGVTLTGQIDYTDYNLLPPSITLPAEGELKLGHLTINQILDYTASVLEFIGRLNGSQS